VNSILKYRDLSAAGNFKQLSYHLSHMCGIAMIFHFIKISGNSRNGKTGNSCLLLVERGKESRHLVF
jgi:hypothetical protein